MAEFWIYASLFLAAFLAATILPAQSELGLAGLLVSNSYNTMVLIAVASIGNTLGATINWCLGRGIGHFQNNKWFPASPKQLDIVSEWYRKYGRWSLLLSWAPVVGDPITVAAGVLREPFFSFLILVGIAKTLRYLIVSLIALQLI
jgi:membrane protein YqaA with SNARE-associated domain